MTLAHRRSQKNWTLVTFCTFMEVANSMEVANYLSVCLNTVSTLYAIPYGLSGAVSTRVSNELGAGNPQGARLFVFTMMLMAVLEAVIVSAMLFACRNVFGNEIYLPKLVLFFHDYNTSNGIKAVQQQSQEVRIE
ncbi:unnamed protein product [Cuscuta campestris]|uniref:Uncharacterized protein n=1 Tax=Cuscuta campestris TaxID=132261 RepID=A0A484LP35_9ASTE|nr:unnamed protein product [Cuscuta campestris]